MSNLNKSRNIEVNNDALISERFLLYHVKQSSIRKKMLGVNENSTHLQSTMRANSRQNQFNKNLDIVYKNKQILDLSMKLQVLNDTSLSVFKLEVFWMNKAFMFAFY